MFEGRCASSPRSVTVVTLQRLARPPARQTGARAAPAILRAMRRALALSIVLLVAAAPATARAALPLGLASLKESRTARTLAPGVRFTRIVRGGRGGGPWRVYVLEIDRARLAGRLGAVLAADRVRSLERPSSMARRRHAIAGVNGGYFAIGTPDLGDPVGVSGGRGPARL